MEFLNNISKAERLTTNITGILKGEAGTVTAAVAGTDYATSTVLNATLDTSWSGSTAPYSKTVTVSGVTADDTPIIDIVMSGTYSTDVARQEAWSYVYRAVTDNDSITFYASDIPTVELPIQIKVVR